MRTMSDFELKSHAEYAKKYPAHEVSFFESMVIPPWAHSVFGATNYSNEDMLATINAYKEHEVFADILARMHPIVIILLYYQLLIYEKLLLSIEPEESREIIQQIHALLAEISKPYPYIFMDELFTERDIRVLLGILRLSRKLDDDLHDPYMRFSRIKKLLARFYRLVITRVLTDDPNELAVIACYLNPYFQKPGGSNNKITKAANEVFDYKKQCDEWIAEFPRVALIAISNIDLKKFDFETQNALYEAALHFGEVASALENNAELLEKYSPEEQDEIQTHAIEFREEMLETQNYADKDSKPIYHLNKQQQKESKRQAIKMFNCLYRNSRKFFAKNTLTLQSEHLKYILMIILNNDKDILPVIADYWHKTYKKFKVHSHSTKFQKRLQDYVEIIIHFFNDKDIGREDDIKLKLFATEFISKCKSEKESLAKAGLLTKQFDKILTNFIELPLSH